MEKTAADFLERFGFPVFCTLALLYVLYALCKWSLTNAAQPLVKGHLDFLKSVQDTNGKQTEILASINEKMDDHKEELRKTREVIGGIIAKPKAANHA